MINRNLLNGLKGFTTQDDNLSYIADAFPKILGNFLRLMHTSVKLVYVFSLNFDRNKFMEFMINLGNAIQNNEFDYIDNIIIDLLSTYHYIYPPYKVIIDLDPLSTERFTVLCNGFKGKKWNDILSPLVDGIGDLLEAVT